MVSMFFTLLKSLVSLSLRLRPFKDSNGFESIKDLKDLECKGYKDINTFKTLKTLNTLKAYMTSRNSKTE